MVLYRSSWLGLVLATTLAAGSAAAAPAPVVVDRIVALVDSTLITELDVAHRTPPEVKKLPAAEQAKQREATVQAIIEDVLVAGEAERRKLTVDNAEVEAALSSIASQNGMTVPQVLAAAAEQGLDATRYRQEMRRQILIMRTAQMWAADEAGRDPSSIAFNDLEAARQRMVTELRKRAYIEVRP